ncbi:MAG TPA: hypothetical protein VKU85_21460 [bacterium]|nr:hypothetical protein [bacterium]
MRLRKATIALAAAALLAGGCSGGGGDSRKSDAAPAAEAPAAEEAVELVRHAYYPREVSEDYWEVVSLADTGSRFLLVIHPRIRTPAEGPWTITFHDPEGAEIARHENLRVDTATGAFTFLCRSSSFFAGDWTIRLVVPEDGMVAGPREREYRFRVE